jgi:plasmid stabilization system protein ParE
MQYLFGDEAEAAARAVERAIRDLVTERLQRAASGREQERRAVRRTVFDPAPIAARVLMDHGRPPSILEMIGAVDADALGSVTLDIPPHELGRAEVGSTLLDMGDVVIGRNRLMSTPSETYSEVIVAVLTTNADYSGSVVLPDDEAALGRVYEIWVGAWVKWRETVEEAIRTVLPRAQQAPRRVQVARELELRTSLPRYILHVE